MLALIKPSPRKFFPKPLGTVLRRSLWFALTLAASCVFYALLPRQEVNLAGQDVSANWTSVLPPLVAILDGAIYGNHCSPISDTTVLSSLSTGCDHLDHVNTQIVYALAAMVGAALFRYLAIGFGSSPFVFYLGYPMAIMLFLWLVGRKPARFEIAGCAVCDGPRRGRFTLNSRKKGQRIFFRAQKSICNGLLWGIEGQNPLNSAV